LCFECDGAFAEFEGTVSRDLKVESGWSDIEFALMPCANPGDLTIRDYLIAPARKIANKPWICCQQRNASRFLRLSHIHAVGCFGGAGKHRESNMSQSR
jgi:hypothetical protein